MQEVKVKNTEILKINEKFYMCGTSLNSETILIELTEEKKKAFYNEVLDSLFIEDNKISNSCCDRDEKGIFWKVCDQDLNTRKYYLEYMRPIISPTVYSLPEDENLRYIIYLNSEDNTYELIAHKGNKLISITDIKEDILVGKFGNRKV